jgi:hypothetical protein
MRFSDNLHTKRLSASFLKLLGVAILPNFLMFCKKLPDQMRNQSDNFLLCIKSADFNVQECFSREDVSDHTVLASFSLYMCFFFFYHPQCALYSFVFFVRGDVSAFDSSVFVFVWNTFNTVQFLSPSADRV